METKNTKRKNELGKKEPTRRLYKLMAVAFATIFVVCLTFLVREFSRRKKAEEQYAVLAEQSSVTEQEVTEQETETEEDIFARLGVENPGKELDWKALSEENEDIYAWIYIPGTQVDYPILQHPTENDYYLTHNLDGSSGYPGCIYTQLLNGEEFEDPNTILYGHNMGNGTMFGSLHEYEDIAFFEEHPYVYVYTPENTLVYEIFTACTFSDAHLIYEYGFTDLYGFESFVDDVTNVRDMKSHVREDVEVSYGDYLLTMSTCIKNHPTERWLVVAVLLNE